MDFQNKTLLNMVKAGLDLVTQAISIHDKDLNLVLANQRYQSMFQLPDRFVQKGTPFRDILIYACENGEYGDIGDIEQFVDEKIALASMFEPHYFERTRSNGTSISVEGSPIDGGGWISVFTDITEIKSQEDVFRSHADDLTKELVQRSEDLASSNRELTATVRALEVAKRELTESRENLELINKMMPAHIAHVNAEGIYTHTNGKLDSIIPHVGSEIVGKPFENVLGSKLWKSVESQFETTLSGQPSVSEVTDEDSGQIIRIAMTPDISDAENISGAFILSTDVTKEVSARRALAHSRRKELAAQLTSALTHDFSNLLTIIMGQQNKLQKLAGNDPELNKVGDTIKAAAKRGRELIENLNQVDVQRKIKPVAVDAQEFVTALEQFYSAALPKSVTTKLIAIIPDDRIIIDAGFAKDALLNLVINASEGCNGKGHIDVRITKTLGGRLEFNVSDNGEGFTDDALANALDPFYSTKGSNSGRGLGLISAFDFAKSCGGDLSIKNNEGGGANVTIKIPYRPARSFESHMVLLVDDDETVRATIRGYLLQSGHTVLEASSADEAANLLALEELAFVLTDLDLGGRKTGLDVIGQVPAHIPKLIVTGLPQANPLRKRAEQICDVLVKPFDIDDLQDAMQSITT